MNEGQCGTCGDPYDLPTPRPHEDGGNFGRGIVGRLYKEGQDIRIRIELITNRRGHFLIDLCLDQTCQDKFVLKRASTQEEAFFLPRAMGPRHEVFHHEQYNMFDLFDLRNEYLYRNPCLYLIGVPRMNVHTHVRIFG